MTEQVSIDFTEWRQLAESGEFEPVLAALEESVALLEQGGLTLAAMSECYELGLRLSRRCTTLLRDAELRITLLDQEYARSEDDSTFAEDVNQAALEGVDEDES